MRTRDVSPEQRGLVDKAVEALEELGGVSGRASSPLVDGSWRLIFTTTPGTASPVQRSFVGVDGFAIYQDIDLFSEVPQCKTNSLIVPSLVLVLVLVLVLLLLHFYFCCIFYFCCSCSCCSCC